MSTMSLKTSTGSNTLALHLVSSSMQLVESQGTITAFLRYKPGPEDWREREGEREGEMLGSYLGGVHIPAFLQNNFPHTNKSCVSASNQQCVPC